MCTHSTFFAQRRQFAIHDLLGLSVSQLPIIFTTRKSHIVRGVLAPQLQVVIKGVGRCDNEPQNQKQIDVRREVTVCCMLGKTPNIHPILGTIELEHYLPPSPIFEYCKNGTLIEFITKSEASHSSRFSLIKEVMEGINHIHGLGIIHGDLKGENILIDDQMHAKICDFGSSFIDGCDCEAGCPEHYDTLLTETYKSPELCMEEPFAPTIQSDIWAFSCLALQAQLDIFPYARQYYLAMKRMAQGHPPATPQQLEEIQNPIGFAVAKIIQGCWAKELDMRPGGQTLLQQLNDVDTRTYI